MTCTDLLHRIAEVLSNEIAYRIYQQEADGARSYRNPDKREEKNSPSESDECCSWIPEVQKIQTPRLMPGEASDCRQMLLKKILCLPVLRRPPRR